ncbi:MAG TPA: endonuclease/exonuclease/phosphatase family protein [Candidatus Saccharimonadales bacterium]
MKLIQLNVWQGRIIAHAARFLKQEDPDILCLQEVYTAEQPVPSWDAFSAMEIIREALPHKYLFFAPLFSFKVAGRPVTMGNAILSRFPIHDEFVEFTNDHYVEDAALEDIGVNIRNYQACEIELPGNKRLSLINHHGLWSRDQNGSQTSRENMEVVKQKADTMPRPLIVTGDMNVTPDSETMKVFDGSLENLTATYKLPTTLSQLAKVFVCNNMIPCDNTLISSGVHVRSYVASDYIVSDHKPVILEFEV